MSAARGQGRALATVALLVADYDEAAAWFTDKLGFELVEDADLGGGKRWVVVAPAGGRGARLLLARADTPAQRRAVGNQAGGRVFLFLETDDFSRDHGARRGISRGAAPRSLRHGGGVPRPLRKRLGPHPAEPVKAVAFCKSLPYIADATRPSSSGQDGALSRRKPGFDSPWAYHPRSFPLLLQ